MELDGKRVTVQAMESWTGVLWPAIEDYGVDLAAGMDDGTRAAVAAHYGHNVWMRSGMLGISALKCVDCGTELPWRRA